MLTNILLNVKIHTKKYSQLNSSGLDPETVFDMSRLMLKSFSTDIMSVKSLMWFS